jgi:hypothetical protein
MHSIDALNGAGGQDVVNTSNIFNWGAGVTCCARFSFVQGTRAFPLYDLKCHHGMTISPTITMKANLCAQLPEILLCCSHCATGSFRLTSLPTTFAAATLRTCNVTQYSLLQSAFRCLIYFPVIKSATSRHILRM